MSKYRFRFSKKPVSGSASLHGIVHDGVRRLVDHLLGLRGKRRGQLHEILGWVTSMQTVTMGKDPEIILKLVLWTGMDSDSNEPVSVSGKSKSSLRKGNPKETKNGVYSDDTGTV
jgi:hypothetical protein